MHFYIPKSPPVTILRGPLFHNLTRIHHMTLAQQNQRNIGILLMVSAVAAIFLMFHHPSHFHSSNLNALIHGGMIAVILVATLGVTFLAISQEMRRPFVLAALLLYGAGSIFNILAALINGFVVPQWLAQATGPNIEDIQSLAWIINQNAGRLAVYTHGLGILSFGIHLLLNAPTRLGRLISLVSLLIGSFMPLVLVLHDNRLTVHTALIIYSLESIWLMAISLMLIWTRSSNSEPV